MIRRDKISVEISEAFHKDRLKLKPQQRDDIKHAINTLVDETRSRRPRLVKLYRSHGVDFPAHINNTDSSLYMYKATNDLRVILAYDDDPIFNQNILTLYRVVHKNDSTEAFNQVAKVIYSQR